MTARGLIIAAPNSGAGKTTITLGLLAALKRKGIAVKAAKAGPDYIDPAFHAAATGTQGFNLDTWAMERKTMRLGATCWRTSRLDLLGARPVQPGSHQLSPTSEIVG